MYIPDYLQNHAIDIPHYLESIEIDSIESKLPKDVEWFPLPNIFFQLGTLEKILDFCVINERPIIIIIEGASGEAKTSLTILLLQYALWRYSNVDLNADNFFDFFLLGEYISLDPKIIAELFKERNFFVVDEFHLIADRMRSSSNQNKDVNKYADTMRQKQIFLIAVTIFSGLIDKSLVDFKVSIRIIVKYNSMKKNIITFDIQVNCKGIDPKDGAQTWRYVTLEKDRKSKWCNSILWELSKVLKDGMVYGKNIKAYMSSKEWKNIQFGENKEILRDSQEEFIFKKYTKLKDIVRELMKANYNQQDIITSIKTRLGKKTISYAKYKLLEKEIKIENSKNKNKN